MANYDMIVTGGSVVFPEIGVINADLGIVDGKIATIADHLDSASGTRVVNASGKIVFPGGVDPHYHLGIYQPLGEDTFHETRSSLVGGVTTVISYFRTGSHYLDKTGSYAEIFPEVLAETKGQAHVDFGFHLAPMTPEHVDEIDRLVDKDGVSSFKYYMFYRGLNLAADSTDAASYTMAGNYDLGHLYSIMEAAKRASIAYGDRGRVSVSIHCEEPELLKLFIGRVRASDRPQDLHAYSDARPPVAEQVAIEEAVALANATGCPINLLHLSSSAALESASAAKRRYPHLDIKLETTLHFLSLTADSGGLGAKVNPPLRTTADIEAMWQGIRDGEIDWVGSDHASCMMEQKGDELWPALPGFGGTSLMYPLLMSEGYHKRGIPLTRIAELASTNGARAYGLYPKKGTISIGGDADLTIIDPELEQVVDTELLMSAQDHTPFEGVTLKGWPITTILRGEVVFEEGQVIGTPRGAFVKRPA